MARIVLNNRYSQNVKFNVTESSTGTSLGSGIALRDPRTGISKLHWVCSNLTVDDMNFVYASRYKMYLSAIDFTLDGLGAEANTADGVVFVPKVTLRNSDFLIFGGILINTYLRIYILSNVEKPSKPMYSVFVEAAFIDRRQR